jgi:hypothetical protein
MPHVVRVKKTKQKIQDNIKMKNKLQAIPGPGLLWGVCHISWGSMKWLQ